MRNNNNYNKIHVIYSEYFIRDGYLVNNINENSATDTEVVDEAIASTNRYYNIDLSILSDLTLDEHAVQLI